MDRQQEDDEVEERGGERLADIKAQSLRDIGRCVAPAAARPVKGALEVPHVRNGPAREPARDAVEDAPHGGEADEPLAEESPSRADLKDTEVLEEKRDLDEGEREGI